MKKIIFVVILFACLSLSAIWTSLNENTSEKLFESNSVDLDQTNIQFSLNGFELEEISENGVIYKKITYQNEGRFLEFGKPDLPRFTRMYAIPDQGGIRFEITHIEEEIISDITVYPIQELQLESQPNRNSFIIDEQYYNGAEIFPVRIVNISQPEIFRDIRLVNVSINPFQYDPSKRELRIITNIELTIISDISIKSGNVKLGNRKLSRSFENLYKSVIENYDVITSNTDEIYQDPCYLFIHPNNNTVLTTLEYLTDWKEQKGFEVHLANTSQTGSSTTSIKNYIQNAYDNWENPPEFVALVGDAGGSYNIPTYYESYSGYGGEGDHPYALLEGADILEDIILGRISYSTTNELQTIIHKILNYEKEPYMGSTAWYNKSVMVGDPGTSGPSCVFTKQAIKEMMDFHVPDFVATEVYSGNFDSAMRNGINNGCSYFNYRGYYQMSGFNNSDINNLNNGLELPFAVFLTCGTGSFASGTSRSEAFIRAGTTSVQKGAIAAIGTATTGTHTAFNNCVDSGIFWGVFADQIYNPGGALLRGKLHLNRSFPGNPSNKVTIFSYWNNLMGDPGLELWTAIPQDLNVTYSDEVNIGANFLEISVEDDNGFAVENAWVCALSDDGDISVNDFTNEDGIVFLSIQPTDTGSVNLTVTKHNFIPHLGDFDVVNSASFVNVDNYVIDDDMNGTSTGNGDGYINPGESIELNVGLKNFGTGTASSVTAEIFSVMDFITITDAEETFGNITSGSTNFSQDDFDLTVDTSVLGGSEIQLDMVIEDGNGNQWDDHIFIPVAGANLYASNYSVQDGNGILEPGETAQIVVTLFNTGSISAAGIQSELSCSNNNITMVDSLAVFETIQPGQEGDNDADRFEISADIHSVNGSQIIFDLHLFNSNGFDQNVSFIINIGVVTVTDPLGPDEYGYIAYDSTDDDYDLAPEYDWIEIDPDYGGSGSVLNLNDNGDTGDTDDVNLPFDISFYGISYDMITVCSNGWIAPGGSDQASFMNSQIPAPHGPSPMIAVFWDDLKMSSGDVYYYHDQTIHAFIVEWSHLKSDWNNNIEETFQVLIYDPSYYPTPTGDVEILFQYETISNVSVGSYGGSYVEHGQYSTVGLEDHTSTIGLEYTYNNSYPTAAATLQAGLAIKFTTNGSGVIQAPPVISLSQNSFDFILQPQSSDSQILEITNNGEANLIYDINKNYDNSFDGGSRNQGGPDNYGYVWIDSNEPNGPTYNWRDISGFGTEVTFTNNDEGTDLMPIGFDFNYYGTDYSQFRINPNGWIGFGNDSSEWSNSELPDEDAPKPAIMPFWDDLNPIEGGNVYYYSTSDSLVVWFDDVIHYVGTYNGTYDFQVIIYENGDIFFQYRDVSGDLDTSTIGIQNENADDGLLVVYNNNYVEDELAIRFRKVIDWLQLDSMFGFIEEGQTETINLSVSSEELAVGDYSCDLILTSNDPDAETIIIPVNLLVSSSFPNIYLSQNNFNFGTVVVGETATDTLTVHNLGNQVLNVTDISISLPEFTVNTSNFSVDPNNSVDIYITFTPLESIEYDTEMSISSNDPLNPVMVVNLNGDALYPIIELSEISFDFELVDIGLEVLDTLVVSNLGTDILHITSMDVSGEVFNLDLDSFELLPSESQNVIISFIPENEITYNDTITIYSNDFFDPVLQVLLSGTGNNPVGSGAVLPEITKIHQNYPNPFNPDTTIRYSISEFGKVTISIYNIKGEKVRILVDSFQEPQWYDVVWNGRDENNKPVSSGVYFYRFKTSEKNQIRKMLLIK